MTHSFVLQQRHGPLATRSTALHTGWQLAEVPALAEPAQIGALPASAWLPASVPGTTQGALMAAGLLPDLAHGTQETEVQWVGERTWGWRLHFDVPGIDTLAPHEELVFDGLDTVCSAWLNGHLLFTSSNMFVPLRADIRALLQPGSNELLLRFDPPLAAARALEATEGQRRLWNGDSARLHLRKAQYHFGWDWGPVLLTSGPWQTVRRESWHVRLAEVHPQTEVNVATRRADVRVSTQLLGQLTGLTLSHTLRGPDGALVAHIDCDASAEVSAHLVIEAAQLWWPRGLGDQPLYELHTCLHQAGRVVAQDTRRIGLRTVALVQAPVEGEAGTSFCFEVNGQEVFIGGANWIPDHNLLERVTPARVRARVAQAAAGHMNMLRVWGGGIYESEAFYDACDELGLLVWQDFLFACGMYPANPAFEATVMAEAAAAVKRLRHRASLALWCGNNEDYAVAESIGAHGPGIAPGQFDARLLYEERLPALCAELQPGSIYWPGSPWTPGGDGGPLSSDPTAGDRHSWEVWHQQMLPYQRYEEVQGRFVSEFGMQSHASLAVLHEALPKAERYPESRTLMWHNKAGSGEPDGHRRLAVYMADNLRSVTTLAEHVYATQFIQAEAMRCAYQAFRRRWQTPGARAVGGALVWQLNDCWPAVSWAIIDSGGHLKPAWHSIRRALAPLAVALRLQSGQARLTVMNAGPARAVKLALQLYTLDGVRVWRDKVLVNAEANASTERLVTLPDSNLPVMGELLASDAALHNGLHNDGNLGTDEGTAPILARDCAWPEPFKFHTLPPASPHFELISDGLLRVQCSVPVKGLWMEAEGVMFEDNFIDLAPGSAVLVPWHATSAQQGLGSVRWRALEQGERHTATTRAGHKTGT